MIVLHKQQETASSHQKHKSLIAFLYGKNQTDDALCKLTDDLALVVLFLIHPRIKAQERVHLGGAKKEEEAFEVCSQGMFKTELCNKWQETGTCPYGDNCQFAHGIAELRPVIRHPRYKTEVCRMVLAGDSCPYGHRCHFRHSLSEQEAVLAQR